MVLLLPACREEAALTPPAPLAQTNTPPLATLTPAPTPVPSPTPLVTAPLDGVPQHRLDVLLDYDGGRLEVSQRVRLHNPTAETWQELVLFVPPAHLPDFTISGAEVTTRQATHTVSPTLEGVMYRVTLPLPLAPGDPAALEFSYAIAIPPVAPTDWPPVGNLGAGARLLQAGDWHAVLAPYDAGVGWRTWSYHPVGDPTVYPLASFEVELSTPPDVVIAAPGALVSEGPSSRYRLTGARNFAFLASREYEVAQAEVNGIPVSSFYLPEHAEAGHGLLRVAERSLQLFTEYYGPYPYPELVIAENAYYGAMEYSALISMSGYGYGTYDGSPYSLLLPLTVHEIAHQWWFGAVGNDQVHEPWLDEAFAKYSELLYLERYHPEAQAWWWEAHIDRWEPSGRLNRTIYDFEGTPAYIHAIYGLGAHFMAELRNLMGDEAFFTFVHNYRAAHDGELVTPADFVESAEAHSQVDLEPLFSKYFGP